MPRRTGKGEKEKATLKLKVAEAYQQDVGRGVARLSRSHLNQLGVSPGEPIAIKGGRLTGAIAAPAYRQDEGVDIIRLDGLLRSNAGASIGDTVEVQKANWKDAISKNSRKTRSKRRSPPKGASGGRLDVVEITSPT